MSEKVIKLFLLVVIASFVIALIYKAINPNDYRHPRDRTIKLY